MKGFYAQMIENKDSKLLHKKGSQSIQEIDFLCNNKKSYKQK